MEKTILPLARYYFALDDLDAAAAAADAAKATVAWELGAEYLNAYVGLVNRAISPRVGGPHTPPRRTELRARRADT